MEPQRIRGANEVDYGELPELTRALRALGSARQGDGSHQFFLPLLEARRRAARAGSATDCVHAFDSAELRRALDRAIERIVSDWPDTRASARRALRAELLERSSGYTRALALLAEQTSTLLAAAEAARVQAWRDWTAQLAATFDAADRSWISLRPVVEALAGKGAP